MAGHALVVRRGFHRDRLAQPGVARVDHDPAGPRAVFGALVVLRAGSLFLSKRLYGVHLDGGPGQAPEELREFRIHLRDIAAIQVQNLFPRTRMEFRVFLDRSVQALHVRKPELPRDLEHLRFDLGDLLQADLMDLFRRQVRRRRALDLRRVTRCPVGQRPHSRLRPSLRGVLGADERREPRVGGEDRIADRHQERFPGARAVLLGEFRGDLGERPRERSVFRLRLRHSFGLNRDFLQEELRRHQPLGHALAHPRHRVVQHLRKLSHPGDIVVVVLDGLEGEERNELRRVQVDSRDLVDGHLPALEPLVLQILLEAPDQKRLRQRLLLRKAGGIDGLEAREELPRLREALIHPFQREVGDLVVPAFVTQDRGELRGVRQAVFPMFGQQFVERLAAGGEIRPGRCGAGESGCHQEEPGKQDTAHGLSPQAVPTSRQTRSSIRLARSR